MNKLLLSSAIASLSPLAHADDSNGRVDTNQLDNFFVSGSIGKSDYRNGFSKDNGVYQNLSAGWRWNGIVGPEIGYAFLGRSRDQAADGSASRLRPQTGLIGINAKYDVYGHWFVTAHGGYLRSRTKASEELAGARLSDTSHDNGWYGGVGLGHDISSNLSVGINYDNYHVKYDLDDVHAKSNIAAYSATVQYRF